jgi:hypothetical protein
MLLLLISNLDQLPDLDAIVRGEDVTVPKETDLQYAVASALVGRAIRAKNTAKTTKEAQAVYGNILDYAAKFSTREMGVMLVSDMHRAIGQELFEVPAFSSWANVIADVMLYS